MSVETCRLCGYTGPGVEAALIEWARPEIPDDGRPPQRFGSEPRCRDHAACRTRLERAGDEWPVVASAAR